MSRFPCPTANAIARVLRAKGHRVYESPSGDDLNIVGIRTSSTRANEFDDWLTVFYAFDGVWNLFGFPATTDPGTYHRLNPINVRGTAVVKPGQYRGAYRVGRHQGYKALQQKGPITVYRDSNRDDEIDTTGMEEDRGLYAINIHRASRIRASRRVDRWSAGCQVLQDPDHFAFLMVLSERAAEKFGNSLSYTLIEEADFT